MRDNVRAFVRIAADAFQLTGPVYEFGSYRVDDQQHAADLRPYFEGQRYVGCDMRAGPGVDRIEDLGCLKLPDETASTIICVDTLEHVFEARRAVDELIRVLAPGGALLVTSPLDFRIHNYPDDYWRLTPSCLSRLMSGLPAKVIGWQGYERFPHTVFALGFKAPLDGRLEQAGRFIQAMQHWAAIARDDVRWIQGLRHWVVKRFGAKSLGHRLSRRHEIQMTIEAPLCKKWRQSVTDVTDPATLLGSRIDRS